MHELEIRAQQRRIRFPERIVLLALAPIELLGRLVMRTNGLAELVTAIANTRAR